MILYYPTDMKELRLIYETHLKAFPSYFLEQPFFYPVLNFVYAEQVARDRYAKSEPFAGYITRFSLDDTYATRFEHHNVEGHQYEEFWVPAEQLEEFNHQIIGHIEITGAYFGLEFHGYIPEKFGMRHRTAIDQFLLLVSEFEYNGMDFQCEIIANNLAVFLHYPFWMRYDFSKNLEMVGIKKRDQVLQAIREVWSVKFSNTPLAVLTYD